jgi:hypothetical protein
MKSVKQAVSTMAVVASADKRNGVVTDDGASQTW